VIVEHPLSISGDLYETCTFCHLPIPPAAPGEKFRGKDGLRDIFPIGTILEPYEFA
jgi:hypothetical protein